MRTRTSPANEGQAQNRLSNNRGGAALIVCSRNSRTQRTRVGPVWPHRARVLGGGTQRVRSPVDLQERTQQTNRVCALCSAQLRFCLASDMHAIDIGSMRAAIRDGVLQALENCLGEL